jgi:hypothetical protein
VLRTSLNALSAYNAQTFVIPDTDLRANTLRAMAPYTVKGTSFQEHRSTYPGTIVDGKSFYLKN